MERETLIENNPELRETSPHQQQSDRLPDFIETKTDNRIVFLRELINGFTPEQPRVTSPAFHDWAYETQKIMVADIMNVLSPKQSAKYLKYLSLGGGEAIKEK